MGGLQLNHPFIVYPSAIAGALITWQIIWKRGIIPVYHFLRKTITLIDRITDEFTPNGGDSLRDRVDSKADKADVKRIEDGVLEAIRIGTDNQESLAEVHAHVEGFTWQAERHEVLTRLKLVEERQEVVRVAIMEALRPVATADGAFGSLIQQVITALEHQPSAEKAD